MAKTHNVLIILIFILLPALNLPFNYLMCQSHYTYYGYVPGRIWEARPVKGWLSGAPLGNEWRIVSTTISDFAYLMIVACEDETKLTVYRLPSHEVLKTASLKMMDKLFVKLRNGTFFKVVSNKPLSVTLIGGKIGGRDLDPKSTFSFVPNSFYTSVDGGFVGREFIFIASQELVGAPYRIVALESAEIIIKDENDSIIHKFRMTPGQVKDLSFKAFHAYRIISTGNIVLHTTHGGCLPSIVNGGYTGKCFISPSTTHWWPSRERSPNSFQLMALEETRVRIYDLELQKKIGEFKIPSCSSIKVKPPAKEILIQSEKPISVMYVSNDGTYGYGGDMTFMRIEAGETALVYIPTKPLIQRAFLFALKDTIVTIDDVTFKLDADDVFSIPPGLHRITPSNNVLIQIIYWSGHVSFQGLSRFAAIIPAVEITHTKYRVDISAILKQGSSPSMHIAYLIAIAIAISAAITFYLLRRRRQ